MLRIMFYILLIIIVLAVLLGPQMWAGHVLKKYSRQRDDIPGSGGELVEHLREKFGLTGLKLETTQQGDHYDPTSKTVRLSEQNRNGHSLTAVAVAAHEFGHALQHARNYRPLNMRSALVQVAATFQRLGSGAILVLPLLALSPAALRFAPWLIALFIFSMAIGCIVHFITLPVEFDASFGRALPILEEGQYINRKDHRAVKNILTACAMTYLAASLSSLLNFWRWFRVLRR